MIAPTLISNFDEIVKKMIFNSEGQPIRQPSIIRDNDHTVKNKGDVHKIISDMCAMV